MWWIRVCEIMLFFANKSSYIAQCILNRMLLTSLTHQLTHDHPADADQDPSLAALSTHSLALSLLPPAAFAAAGCLALPG